MKNKTRKSKRRVSGIEKLAKNGLIAAAGWILYSSFVIDHHIELPDAIPAERKLFYSPSGGKISYYNDQQSSGRPLVLIHSVNAAASAYEMRPLFEHYRSSRPVYALDLPGYGFSERSDRPYTPEFYEIALLEFVRQVVHEPADFIALSLGSEFLARAAVQAPELFHSLTLISPSGLSGTMGGSRSQKAGSAGRSQKLYRAFSFPVWNRPLFDILATRNSIRYFLRKSFIGIVPEAMVDYAYATAHQPGAENVPLRFISGGLFTKNVSTDFYEKLSTPTLIVYDRDPYTSFELLPAVVQHNDYVRATRIIPTLGLPHWEQLAQTTAALDSFWHDLA